MPTLGSYGELDYPDKDSNRAFLINGFLTAIEEIGQAVIKSLYLGPFQFYVKHLQELNLMWPEINSEIDLESIHEEKATAMLNVISDWALTQNLNAKWCVETIYETCRFWPKSKKNKASLSFTRDGWGGWDKDYPEPPPTGLIRYEPLSRTRSAYLSLVQMQIDEAFTAHPVLSMGHPSQRKSFVDSLHDEANDYCQKVEDFYLQQGYVKSEESGHLYRNFTWAVKFQVLECSYTEIAKSENVSVSTVKRSVDEILMKLGLTKRPDAKRGRPSGRKDSPEAPRQRRKQ